jgi:hypothetical protein
MLFGAMLAVTAGYVGRPVHAKEFHENAKSIMASYYGKNDLDVACKLLTTL